MLGLTFLELRVLLVDLGADLGIHAIYGSLVWQVSWPAKVTPFKKNNYNKYILLTCLVKNKVLLES